MPRVVLSALAENDVHRLFEFLAQYDRSIAARAVAAILDGIDTLETAPFRGSPLLERPLTRKWVVDFGATGYLVFHTYTPSTDTVHVARVLHQKEDYSALSIAVNTAV
jgi:plasmid stabilization system protein ParE